MRRPRAAGGCALLAGLALGAVACTGRQTGGAPTTPSSQSTPSTPSTQSTIVGSGDGRPAAGLTVPTAATPNTLGAPEGAAPGLTIPLPAGLAPGIEAVRQACGAVVVVLPGELLFRQGSSELPPDAAARLQPVVDAARRGAASVTVAGFASAEGDPAGNLRLADARAGGVAEALRSLGAGRVASAPGSVLGRPTDPPDVLAANRRVTVTLENAAAVSGC